MMGYITHSFKSCFLLLLTSFIWVNTGSANAQSAYPNPFAPSAGIGTTSIPQAGPSNYPNPFAPVAPPVADVPADSAGSAAGGTTNYPNPFGTGTTDCPPLANTNVAVCPTRDNNVYFTTDGTFFKIQCAHRRGTTTIQITTAQSFQQCIDKCGQESTCNSVNYVPASSQCSLLSSTGAATVSEASANQHYAYKVDPPTQLSRDENLVVCSTSCPSG